MDHQFPVRFIDARVHTLMYEDRAEAGERLGEALLGYKNQRPIILALPRGGAVVAAPVARMLDAPLDLLLVRKIGVPWEPELAMGAVVDGGEPSIVRNEDIIALAGLSEAQFQSACQKEIAEIERRRSVYLEGRPRSDARGRTVIVVDDGIATGATIRAALKALRHRGAKRVILAVPVAPESTLLELEASADVVVCLECPEPFYAIGAYYYDFRQVSDEEVINILAEARAPEPAASQ